MLTKLATFKGVSSEGEPLVQLFRPGDNLMKLAGSYTPEVQDFVSSYQPDPNKIALLINALGASEYWGQNVNGDIFLWDALIHDCRSFQGKPVTDGTRPFQGGRCPHPYDDFAKKVIPDYGYWTFLNAHPFVHHRNKDPSRAFGKVLITCLNHHMKRVELVVEIDRALAAQHDAQHVVDRIDSGEFPDVSMGCRVPYDVCAICGNKSKTRKDYCNCVRHLGMGRVLDDGRRVGVINLHPRFFDISFVFIGADKTAKVMQKLGSGELWLPESVRDADQLYAAPQDEGGLTKAASAPTNVIDLSKEGAPRWASEIKAALAAGDMAKADRLGQQAAKAGLSLREVGSLPEGSIAYPRVMAGKVPQSSKQPGTVVAKFLHSDSGLPAQKNLSDRAAVDAVLGKRKPESYGRWLAKDGKSGVELQEFLSGGPVSWEQRKAIAAELKGSFRQKSWPGRHLSDVAEHSGNIRKDKAGTPKVLDAIFGSDSGIISPKGTVHGRSAAANKGGAAALREAAAGTASHVGGPSRVKETVKALTTPKRLLGVAALAAGGYGLYRGLKDKGDSLSKTASAPHNIIDLTEHSGTKLVELFAPERTPDQPAKKGPSPEALQEIAAKESRTAFADGFLRTNAGESVEADSNKEAARMTTEELDAQDPCGGKARFMEDGDGPRCELPLIDRYRPLIKEDESNEEDPDRPAHADGNADGSDFRNAASAGDGNVKAASATPLIYHAVMGGVPGAKAGYANSGEDKLLGAGSGLLAGTAASRLMHGKLPSKLLDKLILKIPSADYRFMAILGASSIAGDVAGRGTGALIRKIRDPGGEVKESADMAGQARRRNELAQLAKQMIDESSVEPDARPNRDTEGVDAGYGEPKTEISADVATDNDRKPEDGSSTLHTKEAAAKKLQVPPHREDYPFAGQYKWDGMTILVENPAGTWRQGRGWKTKMKHDYGEIEGSLGADGDPVDVYMGSNEKAQNVYIIHQNHVFGPKKGEYDEDKVMLGFTDARAAKKAYLAHYDRPQFLRSITEMPLVSFKKMILKGEADGEKIAATKEDEDTLARLFDRGNVRRERTWRNKVTGEETNHVGSGLGKSFEDAKKTASAEDPLENIFKLSADKKATDKKADIEKEIDPSVTDGRITEELTDREPPLGGDCLDGMVGKGLESALTTPSMMGMVLKPREFQRMMLNHQGQGAVAQDLDDKGVVFGPSDQMEAPCGSLDPDQFNGDIMKALMPLLSQRSYLGPVVKRRIIRIRITPKLDTPTETCGESPLLSKLGAAYNWYRNEMMKVATYAPTALEQNPELQAAVFGVDDSDLFAKQAGSLSASGATIGAVLASVPLSLMYSASLRRDAEQGQNLGLLKRMIADHSNLSAMGAGAVVKEIMKNEQANRVVRNLALETVGVAKRIWTGGA